MTWRPLSLRNDPVETEFDAIHEGVPTWLHSTVLDWVRDQLTEVHSGVTDVGRLRQVERRLHLDGLDWQSYDRAKSSLLYLCINSDDDALDIVDALLHMSQQNRQRSVVDFAQALQEAGSAWQVTSSGSAYALERRVDGTVAVAGRDTVTNSGRAGQHLAEAWSAAYGRQSNPSHAYREAVRAVETAAIPKVCPNDQSATLGRIIGQLRSRPVLAAALQPAKGDPAQTLISMLELLWTAQLDRHGTPDTSVPLMVTDVEARTAVHLATTVVQWLTSDGVVAVNP